MGKETGTGKNITTQSGKQLDDGGVEAGCRGVRHVLGACLGGLPVGDLDEQVGVVQNLVAGATEESALGRPFRGDQARHPAD